MQVCIHAYACIYTMQVLGAMASGALSVGDKSDPEEIADVVGLSKKNFKDAVGLLYRQNIVDVHDREVRLEAVVLLGCGLGQP